MGTLRVSEIVLSIQGESSRAGLPCVLVRLAGCNLRCSWCDTPQARDSKAGREMTPEEILAEVQALNCLRVELTGGEPLLQDGAADLLRAFCEAGYETLLETNGSVDISAVDSRVRRIVDVKCPSSGHVEANLWENLGLLTDRDEVKFVIADREDYDFAKTVLQKNSLAKKCAVFFSPVWEKLPASTLAEWILADRLDVRLGMQLHKILWPKENQGR
ncbi:MAG: radical SAM protein [Phycisphaerae bacterium]|nr:radical SAM protein [Phycisphaerae bacterium]